MTYHIDEVLLKKAMSGDMASFERLIINHEKLVYNACFRIMGDQEDAKDASQEVFIKLYKNIDKCNNLNTFKAWLYRIIHNCCIDLIRKKKGKKTLSIDKMLDTPEGEMEQQIKSTELSPEEEYLQKEAASNIQRAITKLSDDYRTLVVLRDIQGLSYEEISAALDIPMGTVKSRISRSRQKLKSLLAEG